MLFWYNTTDTHPYPVAVLLPGLGPTLLRSINVHAAVFYFNCSKLL